MARQELSPTARVVLGLLSWRPMSGYDVKSVVDRSTRFFWAASYGQIYPELRRLADAGLIEPQGDGDGDGRGRKVYGLTAAGRDALRGWLTEEPEVFEMRDEGLLKLFFASAAPQTAIPTLEAKRRAHLEAVERLREIERTGKPEGFPRSVLRYGIECNTFMAQWCERAAAALADDERRSDR